MIANNSQFQRSNSSPSPHESPQSEGTPLSSPSRTPYRAQESTLQMYEQKIRYYNDTACYKIGEAMCKDSLVFLKEAEKMLEAAAEGVEGTLHVGYFVAVLQNCGCAYARLYRWERSEKYLQLLINNIQIYLQQNSNTGSVPKILYFTASKKQKSTLKSHIHKYFTLVKYTLYHVTIQSQIGHHEQSIRTLKKCLYMVGEICERIMQLEIVSSGLDIMERKEEGRVLEGLLEAARWWEEAEGTGGKGGAEGQQQVQKVFEKVRRLKNGMEGDGIKIGDNPALLKLINETPLSLTALQPTTIESLLSQFLPSLSSATTSTIPLQLKLQLTIYTSLCYFLLATENRILAAEKYMENRKISAIYRASRALHFKAIEVYVRFVGSWGKFGDFIVNSFEKNYDIKTNEKEGVNNQRKRGEGRGFDQQISQIPVDSQDIDHKTKSKHKKIQQSPQKSQKLHVPQLNHKHHQKKLSNHSHNDKLKKPNPNTDQLKYVHSKISTPEEQKQYDRQINNVLGLQDNRYKNKYSHGVGRKREQYRQSQEEQNSERDVLPQKYLKDKLLAQKAKKLNKVRGQKDSQPLTNPPANSNNKSKSGKKRMKKSVKIQEKIEKSVKAKKNKERYSSNQKISKNFKVSVKRIHSEKNVSKIKRRYGLNEPTSIKVATSSRQQSSSPKKFSIYGIHPMQHHLQNITNRKTKRKTQNRSIKYKTDRSYKNQYSLQRKTSSKSKSKSKLSRELSNSAQRLKITGYNLAISTKQKRDTNAHNQRLKNRNGNTNSETQREYLLVHNNNDSKNKSRKIDELIRKYNENFTIKSQTNINIKGNLPQMNQNSQSKPTNLQLPHQPQIKTVPVLPQPPPSIPIIKKTKKYSHISSRNKSKSTKKEKEKDRKRFSNDSSGQKEKINRRSLNSKINRVLALNKIKTKKKKGKNVK